MIDVSMLRKYRLGFSSILVLDIQIESKLLYGDI